MDPLHEAESGVTLIEMLIVSVFLPLILGAAIMAMSSSNRVRSDVGNTVDATHKLRTVLRRIGDDLRVTSRTGEDLNENGALDAGEDGNSNGRLDADWATTATSLTLNKLLADGTWSLPITYRLDGDTLEMERMIDADGTLQSVVIARSVSAFDVSVSANEVTVELSADFRSLGGEINTESSSITVVPRN